MDLPLSSFICAPFVLTGIDSWEAILLQLFSLGNVPPDPLIDENSHQPSPVPHAPTGTLSQKS